MLYLITGTIQKTVLIDLLASAGIIANDVRFHIDENGMHAVITDTGNVFMGVVKLDKAAFTNYQFSPSVLCLDVIKTRQVLSTIDTDTFDIFMTESSGKLVVTGGNYVYNSTLIADQVLRKDNQPPVKVMQNEKTKVTIDAGMLQSTINAIKNINEDIVKFTCNAKDRVLTISSDDVTKDNVVVNHKEEPGKMEIVSMEDGISRFTISYIGNMARIFSKAKNVTITMAEAFPIRFSFVLDEHISLDYVIAPRMDD